MTGLEETTALDQEIVHSITIHNNKICVFYTLVLVLIKQMMYNLLNIWRSWQADFVTFCYLSSHLTLGKKASALPKMFKYYVKIDKSV